MKISRVKRVGLSCLIGRTSRRGSREGVMGMPLNPYHWMLSWEGVRPSTVVTKQEEIDGLPAIVGMVVLRKTKGVGTVGGRERERERIFFTQDNKCRLQKCLYQVRGS